MTKIVMACVTAEDLSAIRELSARHDGEVIAVAFDLGDGANLRELHDLARAAGAARCHVLDLRDGFARECVLPAIDSETAADGADEIRARAREFVATTLASIAALEGAAEVVPATVAVAVPSVTRAAVLDRSARVDIAFEDGVPQSVNGVSMSLVELLDVLATIGAAHGVARAEAGLRALQVAHQALASPPACATGSARLEIFEGRITAQRDDVAA